MKMYFKLIRWPNILMICAIQYILRYQLVIPKLGREELLFNDWQFALLCVVSMLIAAGGYAINDYFDVKTDTHNKPEELLVSRFIKRTHVLRFHIGISLLATVLSLVIGIQMKLYFWWLIAPLAIFLLYVYSLYFKRTFLLGNILVSALIALLVFFLAYLELGLMKTEIVSLLTIFTGFAFWTNLIREIIKDVEDRHGDKLVGCKTLPIVLGVNTTKKILVAAILLCQVFILYFTFKLRPEAMAFAYSFVVLIAPLAWCIYLIKFAQKTRDFQEASTWMKGIMLLGMLTILFI